VQDIIPPPQPGDPDTVLLFVAEAPPAKVAAWEVISQARRYTDEGKSELSAQHVYWLHCGPLFSYQDVRECAEDGHAEGEREEQSAHDVTGE
jgi:hypothetical protein